MLANINNRHTDQWNTIENPGIFPATIINWFLTKAIQWKRNRFFSKIGIESIKCLYLNNEYEHTLYTITQELAQMDHNFHISFLLLWSQIITNLGFNMHRFITLQFWMLDIQEESHWDKIKVSANLHSFLWALGENFYLIFLFPAV